MSSLQPKNSSQHHLTNSHKGIGFCELYEGRINQYTYKNTLETCLVPSTGTCMAEASNSSFNKTGL